MKILNRFNLIPKLSRINLILCKAAFIALSVLLVDGPIIHTAIGQIKYPLGVSGGSIDVPDRPQDKDQATEPVTIGEAITLRSRMLDEDRRILVHLPAGYEHSNARYPVLYLLDGGGHFHHVTGITRFLAHAQRIPAMIVVGITNMDRDRDFKPSARVTRHTEDLVPFGATITTNAPRSGGADLFLRFLAEELAPHIDNRYRTADFRLLVGHSAGGLFTLHALLSRPELFNAFIAISPSLWWDEAALVKRAAMGGLPDFGPRNRFLYMAVGDEGGEMIRHLSDLAGIFELADPPSLRWQYRIMPGETHSSMPHRTIYEGLETIFSDYATSETLVLSGDLARVERQFVEASRIYGYEIAPPERLIGEMGWVQRHLFHRPEKAVEIFRRAVELYPESPNAHDNLADALMVAGQFDGAIAHYERAEALRPDWGRDGQLFHAYLALGLVDRAEEFLDRTRERGESELYPGWWHCCRALVAIFGGDGEALAVHNDSLLSTSSDGAPESWECLAFNEVFLRQYSDARTHLERYVAIVEPQEIPLNLGFLHLRAGAKAKGEKILREAEVLAVAAIEQDGSSWEPHFKLTKIAAMRGEVEAAVSHLEEAVDLGLGLEWWPYHLFSPKAVSDPVFESLYEHPKFERLRNQILGERRKMAERVLRSGSGPDRERVR